jgi:multicomponent Na+:H+ antiporter subunit D
MLAAELLLPALILLPLACGALVAVAPASARHVWLPAGVLLLALAVDLASTVMGQGEQRAALGGWPATIGLALAADGLSALMIGVSALVSLVVAAYARAYLAGDEADRFWPLWWWLAAAMNAAYLATDVFNVYVALELLGLAAVGLVAIRGGAVALAAALRYLFAAIFGSLAYLLGVALLYAGYGALAFDTLAGRLQPSLALSLTAALMTTGLLLKSALFPLHYWLPPAHGSAAAPVSAVLSALVVKVSFYLLLRLWFDVFGAHASAAAAQLIGVAGTGAMIWGSLAAMRQRSLKMLVAYSTVAQLGYLFLVFPLATAVQPEVAATALRGAALYVLAHALAKSAMFLAAGAIVHAWGDDDVEHLEGTSARMPVGLFAFGLAGVTLIGLPPSGGFAAKWLLLRSAIDGGQWWWAVAILTGGLLTAIYVFRVLRSAFVPPQPERPLALIPIAMQVSALVLALLSIVLGLTAVVPLALLDAGGGVTAGAHR